MSAATLRGSGGALLIFDAIGFRAPYGVPENLVMPFEALDVIGRMRKESKQIEKSRGPGQGHGAIPARNFGRFTAILSTATSNGSGPESQWCLEPVGEHGPKIRVPYSGNNTTVRQG